MVNCLFFVLQVEAGDVIVRVNGTDVHHFTTKEGIIDCSIAKYPFIAIPQNE